MEQEEIEKLFKEGQEMTAYYYGNVFDSYVHVIYRISKKRNK